VTADLKVAEGRVVDSERDDAREEESDHCGKAFTLWSRGVPRNGGMGIDSLRENKEGVRV